MVAKLREQTRSSNLSFISNLSENRNQEQEQVQAPAGCVVSNGTKIKGDFHSEGDMRLDGFIDGVLSCNGRLVIGRNGQVEGKVIAKKVIVKGRIEGDIEVTETLTLESTAFISGTITSKYIGIESGATYNGKCQIGVPK